MTKFLLIGASALVMVVSSNANAYILDGYTIDYMGVPRVDQNIGSNWHRFGYVEPVYEDIIITRPITVIETKTVPSQSKQQMNRAVKKTAPAKTMAPMASAKPIAEPATTTVASSSRATSLDDGSYRQGNSLSYTNYSERSTAAGMIGQEVKNAEGAVVGKVDDIIVSRNGNAEWIIIGGSGLLGFEHPKAALQYSSLISENANGDVLTNLTSDSLKNAQPFTYDNRTASTTTMRHLDSNHISLARLLHTKVQNSSGNNVADIRNFTLNAGGVDRVVVGVNEFLGIGGDNIAFQFKDMSLETSPDSATRLKLSSAQSTLLNNFKESLKRTN
jgi:sporulation protein YlmC with PRC-barrel domain